MSSLTSALNQGLSALALGDVDEAAVELARAYAQEIDDGGCTECGSGFERMEKLGPKLLAVLEALGMTPRSRVKGGGADDRTADPLDELRQRRRARRDGTPDLDATAAGTDA